MSKIAMGLPAQIGLTETLQKEKGRMKKMNEQRRETRKKALEK